MLVLRLEARHFRGFAHAVVLPRGHALVVGEPRAGRSDLLAALKRVLDPDATKATLEEWDFHGRDLGRDIEIEVVLGELAPDLRHRFLGELEFWTPTASWCCPAATPPSSWPPRAPRPCCGWRTGAAGTMPRRPASTGSPSPRAPIRTPTSSSGSPAPDADQFKRVPRADRAVLPFLAGPSWLLG